MSLFELVEIKENYLDDNFQFLIYSNVNRLNNLNINVSEFLFIYWIAQVNCYIAYQKEFFLNYTQSIFFIVSKQLEVKSNF